LSYGAFVVKRPDSLAEDDTTSGAVVRHALDWMEVDREPYDIVMLLHPTSPIRDPKHIDEAVEKLWASPLDTLASVYRLPQKSHANIGTLTANGGWFGWTREGYMLNASIYAMKREWFLRNNKHTDSASVPLVMDRFHSLDVDEEADLAIAGVYLGECNGL
jgi:CMP-N,N'-diacetyllegionaminic acid synthase